MDRVSSQWPAGVAHGWLVTIAIVCAIDALGGFCACTQSQFAAVVESPIVPLDASPALAITCFDRGVMIKIWTGDAGIPATVSVGAGEDS